MKRERYSIIYSSKTGNTKKLAEAIYNTLPQNKCDYYGTVDKIDDVLSNVIYIGFWTENLAIQAEQVNNKADLHDTNTKMAENMLESANILDFDKMIKKA